MTGPDQPASRLPPFELQARTYADADVVQLVDEVQAEYVVRYGAPDRAVVDPADFEPPDGLFLVGLLDGNPMATGGWRRLGGHEAEIKRMYVRKSARRRGLARVVLAELERTAAVAGLHRLVLNTGSQQPEAIAMYRSAGYGSTTPFGHYAGWSGAVFLAKSLAPAR